MQNQLTPRAPLESKEPTMSYDASDGLPLWKLSNKEAMRRKWEHGRPLYRDSENMPFVGNPLEEFHGEMIDAMNYLEVYRKMQTVLCGVVKNDVLIGSMRNHVVEAARIARMLLEEAEYGAE